MRNDDTKEPNCSLLNLVKPSVDILMLTKSLTSKTTRHG